MDLNKKHDDQVESRIRRIAAGSGSHPNEVKMLLLAHKQFESMVSKVGKSMGGATSKLKQQQLAAQMRKNPHLIQQRLNQMDPKMIQQMGGRENVMAMMQQMAKGGGAGGGGMPSMESLMSGGGMPGMMGGMPGMGGGAAGMPGMGGMDMEQLQKMAQAMGMGGAMGGR